MAKKLISLVLISLFLIISVLAGCSSGKTSTVQESAAAQEQAATEPAADEVKTEETAAMESSSMADEEVLFDSYTTPSDWPKAAPLHGEIKVTAYERTGNSMLASGFCKYDMVGINNYYNNARKQVNGEYPWEFDTGTESVTSGSGQRCKILNQLLLELSKLKNCI